MGSAWHPCQEQICSNLNSLSKVPPHQVSIICCLALLDTLTEAKSQINSNKEHRYVDASHLTTRFLILSSVLKWRTDVFCLVTSNHPKLMLTLAHSHGVLTALLPVSLLARVMVYSFNGYTGLLDMNNLFPNSLRSGAKE